MSIAAGLIDQEMNHKKSFHRRNDSGELDVFEAARYFSGYNEVLAGSTTTFTQKIIREDQIRHGQHRGRISLDMPMRTLLPQQFHHGMEKQMKENNNKKHNNHKQPSSPGGRLASFLNSLFSQSASKKKKSKSSSQSMKDDQDHHESPGGGRRRRRSSISHFRSSSTTSDSKSLTTGFRTPPYIVQTPTKSCKEFRTFSSDHKHALPLPGKYNNGSHVRSSTTLQNEFFWDDKKKREPNCLDDNYKHSTNVLLSEKHRNWGSEWQDKYSAEEKEVNKFNELDDGAESDSSSDLFELQNYDLGYYSSGLPVYETTNMDNIKRGAPISNGPL
ncbi:hypothetical protein RJT34_07014 [Clitoria ternatea]|uniref:Protein BIG GRAIN 1-like E n=1 Tax=Clitoria ternatea TaxID=43366 RepID=A0AAN9PUM1_CLITE